MMMIIGRELQKLNSQAWAYALFRWISLWILIAYCASKGPAGSTAGAVIIAVEIIAVGSWKALVLALNGVSTKDWMDRLTDRIFFKLLIEEFRAGRGSTLEVDDLFIVAGKQAVEDMKRASQDSIDSAGMFGSVGWHWFGGSLSFLWQLIASVLWYGSALYFGGTSA